MILAMNGSNKVKKIGIDLLVVKMNGSSLRTNQTIAIFYRTNY